MNINIYHWAVRLRPFLDFLGKTYKVSQASVVPVGVGRVWVAWWLLRPTPS